MARSNQLQAPRSDGDYNPGRSEAPLISDNAAIYVGANGERENGSQNAR